MKLYALPIVLGITLLACNGLAPTQAPTVVVAIPTSELQPLQPTADVEATVQAALAATSTAAADLGTTVEAAVAATVTAAPPVVTLVPITPAPSPTPVDGTTLSEEELAALIDVAVDEAVAASEAASQAATAAAADDAITQEEVDTVEVYVAASEETIAAAEALIAEYAALYGELATETVALLYEMEADLEAIAASTAAIEQELLAIEDTLNQGLALAEESVAALEQSAAAVQAGAVALQEQASTLAGTVQSELEARAAAALNVQPGQVATDRRGAVESAYLYTDAVRSALLDSMITSAEMAQIAQLGANAGASLQQYGGPALQSTAASIGNLTTQLARGELPAAQGSVNNLLASLPSR